MERFAATPFTIAIDTREGLPYDFAGYRTDKKDGNLPLVVKQKTKYLKTGDYSIVGMEPLITIERKSLSDLFSTLGSARDRFIAELERMKTYQVSAVVVEAQWDEVLEYPPEKSRLNPKTVFRSVLCWQQQFPYVHWNFLPGRGAAETFTLRALERFHRQQQKKATDQ